MHVIRIDYADILTCSELIHQRPSFRQSPLLLGGGGGGALAGAPTGASSLKSLNAATSDSFSTIIQTSFPIGTSLEPAGTKILARYPSSGVSNPMVALSVSISAKRSPSFNLSPSFLAQLIMVPSSMVGERAGSATRLWSG
uniref:Uncharacterized protein n=1 Tax=Cacopsylla melanoneura TaxID=428564 RepID=A0A8D9A336_9HEMI